MAMYGFALLPLINLVKDDLVTQKWYADDGNAVVKLESLVTLHQKLQEHGPAFGYKLTKSNLIVEESFWKKNQELFRLDRHRDCSRTPSARFDDRLRSNVQ